MFAVEYHPENRLWHFGPYTINEYQEGSYTLLWVLHGVDPRYPEQEPYEWSVETAIPFEVPKTPEAINSRWTQVRSSLWRFACLRSSEGPVVEGGFYKSPWSDVASDFASYPPSCAYDIGLSQDTTEYFSEAGDGAALPLISPCHNPTCMICARNR
jgi:hypothetical protein